MWLLKASVPKTRITLFPKFLQSFKKTHFRSRYKILLSPSDGQYNAYVSDKAKNYDERIDEREYSHGKASGGRVVLELP